MYQLPTLQRTRLAKSNMHIPTQRGRESMNILKAIRNIFKPKTLDEQLEELKTKLSDYGYNADTLVEFLRSSGYHDEAILRRLGNLLRHAKETQFWIELYMWAYDP
jgi:hypothetical protein